VPKLGEFPCVDFLLVWGNDTVDLIQCTTAKAHPPTRSTVSKVLDPLKENNLTVRRLIWATAKGGISTYQKIRGGVHAAYTKIPQFVCVFPPAQ